MDLVKQILMLLIGVSVFLLGMKIMSSGLRKSAGNKIKGLFDRFKDNNLAGLGVGAATTAVVQSSDATSIMAIGFLNVGVMSIYQTLSVIMGAYIGTTATGLIVSLSSLSSGRNTLDISLIFAMFAFVGVVLSFIKNDLVKHIGEILSGFGLLFFGLITLKTAFSSAEITQYTQSIFAAINNPIMLFVIGLLFTMLVQSSSASTGVVIIMCSTGAVNVSSALYVALGATVGTVVTTIIATIGGPSKGKRVAIIAFLIRLVSAIIALAILWPLDAKFGVIQTLSNLFVTPGIFIAVFMLVYSSISMFAFLPFANKIVDLSTKLIKDKEEAELDGFVKFIDPKMLKSPKIALMQVEKEIANMFKLSFENYKLGYDAITHGEISHKETIEKTENGIDHLNSKITEFLIQLSSIVNEKDARLIGGFFHVINDIERIGDHAENFIDSALKMKQLDLIFSETVIDELDTLHEIVCKMFKYTFDNFKNPSEKLVKEIHELEEKSDSLKDSIATSHYDRITKGLCKVELSPFLCTLVSELERIADHLTNIGYIYINPTGDEE